MANAFQVDTTSPWSAVSQQQLFIKILILHMWVSKLLRCLGSLPSHQLLLLLLLHQYLICITTNQWQFRVTEILSNTWPVCPCGQCPVVMLRISILNHGCQCSFGTGVTISVSFLLAEFFWFLVTLISHDDVLMATLLVITLRRPRNSTSFT